MTTSRATGRAVTDVIADLGDVLTDTVELGGRLFGLFSDQLEDLGRRVPRPAHRCGCEIPPPCWMPQPLPEVTSHICPGSTAILRVRVTNCGLGTRTIEVMGGPHVDVDGSPLSLGPFDSGTVVLRTTLPGDADRDDAVDRTIWIKGCREHYLHWRVRADRRCDSSVHEIHVEDCPDLVHHWYDHFFCAHPCGHPH